MEEGTAGSQSVSKAKFDRDFLEHDAKIKECRNVEYARLHGSIFLDHAGTTLYSEKQLKAVYEDFCHNIYGNPHSGNASSTLSADIVEQVRYRTLQFFNTTADDYSVVFTSGCTAALKLVAESFSLISPPNAASNHPRCQSPCQENMGGSDLTLSKGQFWYLEDNHTSVLGMREVLSRRGGHPRCMDFDTVNHLLRNLDPNQRSRGALGSGNQVQCENCLFAFPAQSNFNGAKYPLDWIAKVKDTGFGCHGNWYVLLDAAGFVSTSPLDLSKYKPDFVTMSFYKMFGYPTGLGALLVRNQSAEVLHKTYFGGGTVQVSMATEDYHVNKTNISERLEDGTVSFLDIIALRHGFDTVLRVAGDMSSISSHTFSLAQYVYRSLRTCCHGNGHPVAKLYCTGNSQFEDVTTQGPVVTFNLLRASGDYIGYAEVDKLAQLHHIHLRTGCFCNMGACQKHLGLTSKQVKDNFKAGHVCGDNVDLVNGLPTGCLRISFGFMSTLSDCQAFLHFLESCFVEKSQTSPAVSRDFLDQSLAVNGSLCRERRKSSEETASPSDQTSSDDHPDRSKQACRDHQQPWVDKGSSVSSQSQTGTSNRVAQSEGVSQSKEIEGPYLKAIFLYPVKSCGAFKVSKWWVGPRGLLYDRQWMIVTEAGVCYTQKREPRLCLLKPIIDTHSNTLTLTFPEVQPLDVPLSHSLGGSSVADMCQSKVCGDRISGQDCGNAVAEWLERAFGRPGLRLVRQGCHDNRTTTKLIKGLDNVIDRFRSNLVIDGAEAFQEDHWLKFCLGDHTFQSLGPCTRCQMICVNQSTGERGKEPLVSLMTLKNRKSTFGALFQHVKDDATQSNSMISVGNLITPSTAAAASSQNSPS